MKTTNQPNCVPTSHSSSSDDPIFTPSESTVYGSDVGIIASRGPTHGNNYIIRSVSCRRQMTLLGGEVVLAETNSPGSSFWTCIEENGVLSFRNVASGRFLGHDGHNPGAVVCQASKRQLFEWMNVRPHPTTAKGYTIFLEYWWGYTPLGIRCEQGIEKLVRVNAGLANSMAWEFIEIQ